MTSPEAKNMKKTRAFFKLFWNKGQLTFKGQLWPRCLLRLMIHFDVLTIHQLAPYTTGGQMGRGYMSSFLFWRVNSHPRPTQRVPSENPTQELSDGTLNPDLGLNTASAEAKNMKKWTFFKWSWSKGQLTFEGQLWPKGSLWSGLQFDV